jgi:hypothetical protein
MEEFSYFWSNIEIAVGMMRKSGREKPQMPGCGDPSYFAQPNTIE